MNALQRSLFPPEYPARPGYKYRATSAQAAVAMEPHVPTLRDRCLRVLREHGPRTADEVAALIGESILAVRPRITELARQRKVVDTGIRRQNAVSGKGAIVWCAVKERP